MLNFNLITSKIQLLHKAKRASLKLTGHSLCRYSLLSTYETLHQKLIRIFFKTYEITPKKETFNVVGDVGGKNCGGAWKIVRELKKFMGEPFHGDCYRGV